MARPKIKEALVRNLNKTVKFNKAELELIEQKAKKLKMSSASYIRQSALTSDDGRLPKIRLEALGQLRKIGINWNQVAHYLNSIKKVGGIVENDKLTSEFVNIWNKMEEIRSLLIIKK